MQLAPPIAAGLMKRIEEEGIVGVLMEARLLIVATLNDVYG
jgi:hypothetical protein